MNKKLVQINVVCNGSTGRIMQQIQEKAIEEGYEAYSFYGRGKPSNDRCYKICNKLEVLWSVFLTRFFDKHGYGCKRATKKLVKRIKEIDPDVIQLHNIHGYYLNIQILFDYLKTCNKKIVWTLHDCWAFTGHCCHYSCIGCEKWKKECNNCEQYSKYPKSLLADNSRCEFLRKKNIFSDMQNMTIVVPSKWLKKQVEESFLTKYNIEIINNGVDLNKFYISDKSETDKIYEKYKIDKNKKTILGVSSVWNNEKGINIFEDLAISSKDKYNIVMVGLSKGQIKRIPQNIIKIEKIKDIDELRKIYSLSDVFLNPSMEESFSLVTVEAMACGVPAIVTKDTAMEGMINDDNGIVVEQNKSDFYYNAIEKIFSKVYNEKVIINIVKKYDKNDKFKEYINLYERKV